MTHSHLLYAIGLIVTVAACGDDTGGAGGGGAGGGAGEGGAGASPCDTVEPSPDVIAETQVTTEVPTPAGGTIADGTYFLSRFEIYAPATADETTRGRRFDVTGNQIRATNVDDGGAAEVMGGTFATSGTEITFEVTCPQTATVVLPYTATDTELWIFDPSEPNVQVYTKQ